MRAVIILIISIFTTWSTVLGVAVNKDKDMGDCVGTACLDLKLIQAFSNHIVVPRDEATTTHATPSTSDATPSPTPVPADAEPESTSSTSATSEPTSSSSSSTQTPSSESSESATSSTTPSAPTTSPSSNSNTTNNSQPGSQGYFGNGDQGQAFRRAMPDFNDVTTPDTDSKKPGVPSTEPQMNDADVKWQDPRGPQGTTSSPSPSDITFFPSDSQPCTSPSDIPRGQSNDPRGIKEEPDSGEAETTSQSVGGPQDGVSGMGARKGANGDMQEE